MPLTFTDHYRIPISALWSDDVAFHIFVVAEEVVRKQVLLATVDKRIELPDGASLFDEVV
jgi:hypothetical protein